MKENDKGLRDTKVTDTSKEVRVKKKKYLNTISMFH